MKTEAIKWAEWLLSGPRIEPEEQAISDELIRLDTENEKLKTAIRNLHKAKGRYHTQLATCDLFDLVGLPNERPKK